MVEWFTDERLGFFLMQLFKTIRTMVNVKSHRNIEHLTKESRFLSSKLSPLKKIKAKWNTFPWTFTWYTKLNGRCFVAHSNVIKLWPDRATNKNDLINWTETKCVRSARRREWANERTRKKRMAARNDQKERMREIAHWKYVFYFIYIVKRALPLQKLIAQRKKNTPHKLKWKTKKMRIEGLKTKRSEFARERESAKQSKSFFFPRKYFIYNFRYLRAKIKNMTKLNRLNVGKNIISLKQIKNTLKLCVCESNIGSISEKIVT